MWAYSAFIVRWETSEYEETRSHGNNLIMKIQSIKPQLTPLSTFWSEEAQTLRIPTIQRQFVWDAEDVRDLIDSIVNGYPVGAIIIWEPTTEFPSAPLFGRDEAGMRRYVLDGQQRLTALS